MPRAIASGQKRPDRPEEKEDALAPIKCGFCGRTVQPNRRTQRFCPAPSKCRIYSWRDKEEGVGPTQVKHLKALVKVDAEPSLLLKVAGKTVMDVKQLTGSVGYTIVWRVCNRPISWESKAPGTIAVRRAIMEVLDMPDLWDLG